MAVLLSDKDVRELLSMDAALAAVEAAFRDWANAAASNVPRQRGSLPGVTLNVMPSVSTALDAAGVKCYPIIRKDVTVSSSSTMLVYRISTGALAGVMEATALGQIRTGAASGVASKYLARPESRVMTLFGAGWQAESQLEAIARVLPKLERVNVIGRSPQRVQSFCEKMKPLVDAELVIAEDAKSAVQEADVITTITGSAAPVFDGRWLRPGVHINAAGSNFANKRELDAAAVKRADRIVADDVAVARLESGDLIGAEAQAGLDWSAVLPLSDVVAGKAAGRTSPGEVTLFESQGIGLEDLAAACRVLQLARERGVGMEIPIR
jgi:ornithine cyclodeaminase/alanine dehydrogenase-like protein (mu-crystallin family)